MVSLNSNRSAGGIEMRLLDRRLSTEEAVTWFGLAIGGIVGLAQIIAARRIDNAQIDQMPIMQLFQPILVAAGGMFVATALVV